VANSASRSDLAAYDVGGLGRHGYIYEGTDGRMVLSVPERLPNLEMVGEAFPEAYECKGWELPMSLPGMFYRGILGRPIDAWEIIAQFQEDPIEDPFEPLARGRIIMIPPIEYFSIAYGSSLSEQPELG
jgi:hypothetical protein